MPIQNKVKELLMTNSYRLIAIGFLFVLFKPVLAEDSAANNSRSGFYLGAGGIYAKETFDNTNGINIDSAPGFNFRMGYRIHQRIAIEAMGERVNAFDLNFRSARGGVFEGETNTWTGTVNGKFFVLTGKFQPYALLGVGAMVGQTKVNANIFGNSISESVTLNDFVVRYGAGLDIYFTENWLGYLEVSNVQPTGDVNDINYFASGGGIQYRF